MVWTLQSLLPPATLSLEKKSAVTIRKIVTNPRHKIYVNQINLNCAKMKRKWQPADGKVELIS